LYTPIGIPSGSPVLLCTSCIYGFHSQRFMIPRKAQYHINAFAPNMIDSDALET